MTSGSIRTVYLIARLEFVTVLTNPLIPAVGIIILIVALLAGAGEVSDLKNPVIISTLNGEDALITGFFTSWQAISMICSIVAIFLGATMIPYDRWKKSLNVILTKPLYRRDYLLGKFIGLTTFMLIFNTFAILLVSLAMIIFFRGPTSDAEFLWRLIVYIIILTMACSLAIALNMFFGMISKNLLLITGASITYVFFDWIWYNDRILGTGTLSLITPMNLYNKITSPFPDMTSVFDNVTPGQWLNAAAPYIALLFVEILLLLLIESWIFNREDTT